MLLKEQGMHVRKERGDNIKVKGARTEGRRPQLERVRKRPPPASMRRGETMPQSDSFLPAAAHPFCTRSHVVSSISSSLSQQYSTVAHK